MSLNRNLFSKTIFQFTTSFDLVTLCDLVTVFAEIKSVTKSRLHCTWLVFVIWTQTIRNILVNSQSQFVSTIIVSLHLHMHFDINWSFSLICIVHFIIDLIFQMNSIISINLMIKSPLQYTKVQCKTRIVGVNFYFACGILYRYNCKMVLRGQTNQTYSSGFKSRFLGFIMERPHTHFSW